MRELFTFSLYDLYAQVFFCRHLTIDLWTFHENACQEYIAQRSPDFRKTFVKFDGDGDGKISRKEFRMVRKQ